MTRGGVLNIQSHTTDAARNLLREDDSIILHNDRIICG
jgi:hypothetical protein